MSSGLLREARFAPTELVSDFLPLRKQKRPCNVPFHLTGFDIGHLSDESIVAASLFAVFKDLFAAAAENLRNLGVHAIQLKPSLDLVGCDAHFPFKNCRQLAAVERTNRVGQVVKSLASDCPGYAISSRGQI